MTRHQKNLPIILSAYALLIFILIAPQAAQALTGEGFEFVKIPGTPGTLQSDTRAVRILGQNPVAIEHLDLSRGLQLLHDQIGDPNKAIESVVRGLGDLPHWLGVKVKPDDSGSFNLTGDENTNDIFFQVGDTPLCGNFYHVRAKRLHDGGTSMLGSVPSFDDYEPVQGEQWPDIDEVIDRVTEFLEMDQERQTGEIVHKSKCYAVEGRQLHPAYKFIVETGSQKLPVELIAGDKIYDISNRYFSIVGTAKVYRNNPADREMVIVTLPGLIGDGSLTTGFLKAEVPNGYDRATNSDHEYIFSTDSDEYVETAAFTYAQLHYDFMKTLGFKWYGPRPMDIAIHEKPNGQTNNALFVPAATDTSFPRIEIGDGDDVALKGLPKDADVIAHEFGHHVVYRTLQDTKNDSLALHEGLADFFAFARTEDDCLGESICPNGSEACWVASQCLRTADNDLNYEDPIFAKLGGHFQGQLISGMLWDMRQSGQISPDDLNKLVFNAIDYFPRRATFSDFLFALLAADRNKFDSTYEQNIFNAANARGMGELFDGWQPGDDPRLPGGGESLTNPGEKPPSSGTRQTRSDGGASCAINPVYSDGGISSTLLILMILMVPILIPFGAHRVKVPSRNQRRPQRTRQ